METVSDAETEAREGLTIEDLKFIIRESLGLRHLSSKTQADREMAEGIDNGDALAIASVKNLLRKDFGSGPDFELLPSEAVLVRLDPFDQQLLMGGYLSAIRAFFRASFASDLSGFTNEKDTIESAIRKVTVFKPAFLLAKYVGADNGDDSDNYFGLGKCGKTRVAPGDIRASFCLDENDFSQSLQTLGEQSMDRNFSDVLVNSATNLLIERLISQVKTLVKSRSL